MSTTVICSAGSSAKAKIAAAAAGPLPMTTLCIVSCRTAARALDVDCAEPGGQDLRSASARV